MLTKFSLRFVALTFALAMTPVVATAQETSLEAREPGPQATTPVEEEQPRSDSESVVAVLASSTHHAALLSPPVDLPTAADLKADGEGPPLAPAGKGSGTGLGFMIGGGVAFVGGLLIGGTAGTLVAAGGVGLGVYGAIIYF